MSQVKVVQHIEITDPVINAGDDVVAGGQTVQLQHVVDSGGNLGQLVVTQVQFGHSGQHGEGIRETSIL